VVTALEVDRNNIFIRLKMYPWLIEIVKEEAK
jgi:hypothetical protein